jgi:hypothetical protein
MNRILFTYVFEAHLKKVGHMIVVQGIIEYLPVAAAPHQRQIPQPP